MYESTILSLGVLATLLFIQLIVADVIGIKSKHLPGGSIRPDHNNLLFRATRTVANTNESIAIFILAVLFCMYAAANPTHTAYASWGFVAARAAYAVCYYADIRIARSIMFGLSLLFLIALIVIGFISGI